MRRTLLLVGIGTGNPDHLTIEGLRALRRIDVVFLLDKGGGSEGPGDLNRRRRELCRHHLGERTPRFVEVADPPRDRSTEAYRSAVDDWTGRRAEVYRRLLLRELGEGGVGGVLVWGDPSLYDGTLRVVELLRGVPGLELEVEVVPGVASPSVLAARHAITLNRVGAPLHLTTGRRLAEGWPEPSNDVLVMLDGVGAYRSLVGQGIEIYWGANLGTEGEVLLAGQLDLVAPAIDRARQELKERAGWVMDTYLLRRAGPAEEGDPGDGHRLAAQNDPAGNPAHPDQTATG